MSVDSDESDKILKCVRALQETFPADFVLFGGAAVQFHGHERVTYDVDILVRPKTVIDSLKSVQGFEGMAGKLSYRSVLINLLTTIDDRFIRCFYLRPEDSAGAQKQKADLMDAVFWAKLLEKSGEMISDICAAQFKIGCYHALLIRLNLKPDPFQKLLDVGLERLVIPWEDNTLEQKEYYSLLATEGTDPLTTPLDNELYEEFLIGDEPITD
ncbi:hypothetical protein P168DRAFT_281466 [Aspergillus campestris IBT 28561]|uniref:Uncharacterized protein n=1 Tax=Aspergillus campestris (strain IBT 28561) TaxID=1392248 RepID=A0A2I1D5I3_ASPC2|nr:uncharacterized protein P168DRAFT_281466 [Aspergillus campestris IBT 28561]PKY05132.1 hypothetical protein P168DRAFT_281466 [Aspergillus campestris IBT 28561]